MRTLDAGDLTAVILTRDEVDNLPACVETIRWVPELVVVDSGSQDGTVELARDLGLRVFSRPMEHFNVVEQRNWVLQHADIGGRWVLFMDADERVPTGLRDEIVKVVQDSDPDVVGYQLCFKLIFMGRWIRHAQNFPTWIDRLALKERTRFIGDAGGQSWERFDTSQGRVGRLKEPFLHHAFSRGFNRWFNKHLFYASLWADQSHSQRPQPLDFWGLFFGDKRVRGRALQRLAEQVLAISPELRFLYMAVVCGGLLDGVPGLVFSRLMSTFQFMIHLKRIEREFAERGETL